MNIYSQLNSWQMYLAAGSVILFVLAMSLFFMIRAWKAGLQLGLDGKKLKKAVITSVTFTLLPSFSILLGVAALAGTLGIPLPWLRLSVIGALHYETSVADIAARSVGLSGLSASEMTLTAFCTIALLMSAGIIWGMVCALFFGKPYLHRLSGKSRRKKNKDAAIAKIQSEEAENNPALSSQTASSASTASSAGAKKKSFGDAAMGAMFIGLVAAYIGSYVGTWKDGGGYLPLLAVGVSALAMAGFTWLVEKKKMEWLESFSMAGSMLAGMAACVLAGLL